MIKIKTFIILEEEPEAGSQSVRNLAMEAFKPFEAARRINVENPVGRCGRQLSHPLLLVGNGGGGVGGLDRQWVDLLRSAS